MWKFQLLYTQNFVLFFFFWAWRHCLSLYIRVVHREIIFFLKVDTKHPVSHTETLRNNFDVVNIKLNIQMAAADDI